MTNEDKIKFDALEQLRKAAWESFDKRRAFEWKVCIALWTVFVAFNGTVVTGKGVVTTTASAFGITLVALLALVLHCFWVRGLTGANKKDKSVALFFRNQMLDILGVQFPENLQRLLVARTRGSGKFANYSSVFQIGITTILALGTIITIWSAAGAKTH